MTTQPIKRSAARRLLLLITVLPLLVSAQPGRPKPVTFYYAIFDLLGRPIGPGRTDYKVTFGYKGQRYYDDERDHYSYEQHKYKITRSRSSPVIMTIEHGGKTMTLSSPIGESLDSVVFRPGDYTIGPAWAGLFSLKLYGGARISNFGMSKLKAGSVVMPPVIRFYKERLGIDANDSIRTCLTYARKIEAGHGGYGWAGGACLNRAVTGSITTNALLKKRFDRLMNTGNSRRVVRIYPLQHRAWIMHEYIPGQGEISDPVHTISISYDGGRKWQPLLRTHGDERASLVYFPDRQLIGFHTHRFLMVSDYKFRSWKYYDFGNPRSVPELGLKAMMFTDGADSRQHFGALTFSEEIDSLKPDRIAARDIHGLQVTVKGSSDSVRFTMLHPQNIFVPTMSCACGDKDFYYRIYMEEGIWNWKLYRDHTEGVMTKKCECKSNPAELKSGYQYSIPPMGKEGRYYLELISVDGVRVYSSTFWVENK